MEFSINLNGNLLNKYLKIVLLSERNSVVFLIFYKKYLVFKLYT